MKIKREDYTLIYDRDRDICYFSGDDWMYHLLLDELLIKPIEEHDEDYGEYTLLVAGIYNGSGINEMMFDLDDNEQFILDINSILDHRIKSRSKKNKKEINNTEITFDPKPEIEL